ncbi:MAG: hypothetical protein ACJAS9_000140 [Polaribacter sp.]|jgi:hypothetical protein
MVYFDDSNKEALGDQFSYGITNDVIAAKEDLTKNGSVQKMVVFKKRILLLNLCK